MASISNKQVLRDSLQSKYTRLIPLMSPEELATFGGRDAYIKNGVAQHTSDWYHYYLRFDVTPYLEKLKIPVLALNGDKDISVESRVNLNGIKQTLEQSGNTNFEIVELADVNHFFQTSKTNSFQEIYFNEETFSEKALLKIGDWIKKILEEE